MFAKSNKNLMNFPGCWVYRKKFPDYNEGNKNMKQKKTLKDLNLLDRFLFAEAMENPENMQTVLEIVLGKEIALKYLPQVEKETRTSPLYRYVKLDVWTQDMEGTLYDTEVQKKNTNNLPKRSRYYQAMIDSRLLEPGEIEFNRMNHVFIIVIAPFDLFGYQKYRYSFQMACREVEGLALEDGAERIFLNTHGNNEDEVSRELIELLHYMEDTTAATSQKCESNRIRQMQERIEAIKSNEEVSVRYMQEWEERELEKREAREEGIKQGIEKGIEKGIESLILDNLDEGIGEERILLKLEKRFSLPSEKAREYYQRYARK